MKRTLVVALALLLLPLAVAHPADASVVLDGCSSSVSGDFNGDGPADLAVGIPFQDVGGKPDAGAVAVLYGSDTGPTGDGDQLWTQNVANVEGTAQSGDLFGACLAAGDLNNDARADLAIGVPGDNIGSIADAGAVNVIYGSADGLKVAGTGATEDELWTQNSSNVEGTAEANDRFGSALAIGDFNEAGSGDLAIGAPLEDVGSKRDAGSVNVLYGLPTSGLASTGDQLWYQDSPNIEGVSETDDKFGFALAAGDITADGAADLAIGVPEEDVGNRTDAGAVNVLYGAADGLTSAKDQLWFQDTKDIEGVSEANDAFGDAVILADFDGDGSADLAAGAPREDVGTKVDAGAFNVIYGAATGLVATDDVLVPGLTADDFLGATFTGGQFNLDPDSAVDLAVGAPGRNVGGEDDAGAVFVYYDNIGTPGEEWHQDSTDVEETAEAGDVFGAALVSGDYDADSLDDLAIGVPGENSGATDNGIVQVIFGTVLGITPAPLVTGNEDIIIKQGTGGVLDSAQNGDFFGSALG